MKPSPYYKVKKGTPTYKAIKVFLEKVEDHKKFQADYLKRMGAGKAVRFTRVGCNQKLALKGVNGWKPNEKGWIACGHWFTGEDYISEYRPNSKTITGANAALDLEKAYRPPSFHNEALSKIPGEWDCDLGPIIEGNVIIIKRKYWRDDDDGEKEIVKEISHPDLQHIKRSEYWKIRERNK